MISLTRRQRVSFLSKRLVDIRDDIVDVLNSHGESNHTADSRFEEILAELAVRRVAGWRTQDCASAT